MKIEVTQDDIDNGIPGRTTTCPVALALKRQVPGADWVSVIPNNVVLYRRYKVKKFAFLSDIRTEFVEISLPKRATKFIRNYDIGGKSDPHIKPFSFELEI